MARPTNNSNGGSISGNTANTSTRRSMTALSMSMDTHK
eukprot:CAMPEP_0183369054 /NCGR_PEP_ID=MMETSP0164_2-20130417/98127_1 /TAXON_ID=221442 /ORGANISM="Coccolithus pelagicus ssp braarudi, Strain PLY182g" /LENGTH=37 /DNA_ID= /DNA_START= /DNA_END= /DNA_ORIENTATION=